MKHLVEFNDLQPGARFDWTTSERPTFFDTYIKTGTRRYQSTLTLLEYRVGSVHAICNDLQDRDTSFDF